MIHFLQMVCFFTMKHQRSSRLQINFFLSGRCFLSVFIGYRENIGKYHLFRPGRLVLGVKP